MYLLKYQLKQCFDVIKSWMGQYYLKMNDSKTQFIVCGPSRILSEIQIHGINIDSGTTIRFVSTVKNLGILMDNHLTFEDQTVKLKKKCFRTLRNITKIRFLLSTDQLKMIVNSIVVSCLDYCNAVFYGISEKLLLQLQQIQNAAAKLVMGKYKHDHLDDDLKLLHWLPIKKRIIFKIALLSYKSVNGLAPSYLQDLFRYCAHGHSLKLVVPQYNLQAGRRSFSAAGPRMFNTLPRFITSSDTVDLFKSRLKTYLFDISKCELEKLWV